MPMYEYLCGGCKNQMEVYRPIEKRHDDYHCPHCGELTVFRVSLPAVHTWKPLEVELETNRPKVYETKQELKKDCERLGKSMPGLDIN